MTTRHPAWIRARLPASLARSRAGTHLPSRACCIPEAEFSMARLTDCVLRHRRLALVAWLVMAVAGFATAGKATSSLSASFDIPGQAFTTDSTIQRLYHIGGNQN